MKVYLNGDFVNESDAKISVFDNGFLCGDGIFETMRAYNGAIFALDRHLDRLLRSAQILGLNGMPGKDVLENACQKLLEINSLRDARVRLTVSGGIPNSPKPTVLITATAYDGYDKSLYEMGMSAITLPGYRISNSPVSSIKSVSYLSSIMARRQAVAAGCNEAILINEQRNITEGSFTNIFAVKDKTILTAPVNDGLLPGITRDYVIDIAREEGFIVIEQSINLDGIYQMDELFLTNSLIEIMPLIKVDEKIIGNGRPGPITSNLMALYRMRLG